MTYKFDIPLSRGLKANLQPLAASPDDISVNDVFLHALFARVALTNNSVIEFETKFNRENNTIELIIPDDSLEIFNELTGMQRGPRFKAFINWLVGRQDIISDVPIVSELHIDQQFVPASQMNIWFGATVGLIGDKTVIVLPNKEQSVIGYNLKLGDTLAGDKLHVSLVWMFDSGVNTSFDIQTTANVSDIGGGTASNEINTSTISTFNLIKNDIRSTELINFDVQPGQLLSIVIRRNHNGSVDPQTESISILGLRTEVL